MAMSSVVKPIFLRALTSFLCRFRRGERPPLEMNIPLTSAIMQSVSDDRLAIALAREGGVSFIYGFQTVEREAEMVRRVKRYKAGFVANDSSIGPNETLACTRHLLPSPFPDPLCRAGASLEAERAGGMTGGAGEGLQKSTSLQIELR